VRQDVARVERSRRIDRYVPLVYMLNNPGLIDYKRSAIAKALRFVENSVILNHCSFEVAEEWEGNADVLRKAFVSGNAVDANAEDLCFCALEFGDISLIRLQLFRSTTGEGEHVKCQDHIFLALEVTEFYFLSGGAGQRKIRCRVTHFQVCLWRSRLLSDADHGHGQQQTEAENSFDHRFVSFLQFPKRARVYNLPGRMTMDWREQARMVPDSRALPPVSSADSDARIDVASIPSERQRGMDNFSVDLHSVVDIIGGAPQSSHLTR